MIQAHLAILKKPYLDAILDGRKTIESRFMLTRKPPYGIVRPKDTVFLKISSGLVCAKASIDKVLQYDDLTNEKVCKIRERYGADILWKR